MNRSGISTMCGLRLSIIRIALSGALITVVASIGLLGSNPSQAHAADDSTGLVLKSGTGSDGAVTVRYEHDRNPKHRRLLVQLVGGPTNATLDAEIQGDLADGEDGVLPVGDVTVGEPTPLSDRQPNTYSIDIIFDPSHDQGSGDYQSSLVITGPNGSTLAIPVHVKIKAGPTWPVIVLVLGLLIGYLFKWWGEAGRLWRTLQRRYEVIRKDLEAAPLLLPPDIKEKLADLSRALSREELPTAKTLLDELQPAFSKGVAASRQAAAIQAIVHSIDPDHLTAAEKEQVHAALDRIAEIVEKVWSGQQTVAPSLDELEQAITKLAADAKTQAAEAQQGVLASLVVQTPKLSGPPIAATTSAKPDPSEKPNGWAAVRRVLQPSYLAAHVIGRVLWVLTLAAVAIYGYQTQYLAKATFGSKGLADWISLFGWSFAAALAGKTISDYFGPSTFDAAKPTAT